MEFRMPEMNKVAGYELIFCALSAWYIMAGIILNDVSGKTILKMVAPVCKKA